MYDNCPVCGTKLSKLNKTKIKDDVLVCTNCMGSVPFKEQVKRGNGGFSLEEIKQQVEMKASKKKTASSEKEENTTTTDKPKSKKKKWVLWVLAAIFIIGVIGSLNDDEEAESAKADQEELDNETEEVEEEETNEAEEASGDYEDISTEVELTLNAELNDDKLDFQGETNLPDGTLITYEVWHEEDFEQFADGTVEVEDGKYEEGVSLSEWPDGEIVVWAAFQTVLGTSVEQPDEIIEAFGEMGENIEGDNVSESDVMNRVELEEILTKSTGDEKEESDTSDQEETLSQQNAVSMAEDYLAYTAFSESGLIEQLEFEGFDNEDASYAVSQIEVDWQEQAVIMAEEYLDYTSFSRSGLIEQLEYEGFSTEYATNAVDEVGL